MVAQLHLDEGQHKTHLGWAPNSQLLAITFRVQQAQERGVHIFSRSGASIVRTSSSLQFPAESRAGPSLDLQPQQFEWDPDSTHIAAWVGEALVILSASDCSVTASLPVCSLLGSSCPPAGCSYLDCSWLPGHGTTRLVACTDQAKSAAIFTLAGQQLRRESTPAFASSPVWGALGCAAYLTPDLVCACCGSTGHMATSEVLVWLPHYCVPRPSGASSGGQTVRSGVHVQNHAGLSWSPCGTMLAAGHVRVGEAGELTPSVVLLDWRSGKRLQMCNVWLPAGSLDTPTLSRMPSGAHTIDVHVMWASSGKAVHLGLDMGTEQGGTFLLCSFVAVLPA